MCVYGPVCGLIQINKINYYLCQMTTQSTNQLTDDVQLSDICGASRTRIATCSPSTLSSCLDRRLRGLCRVDRGRGDRTTWAPWRIRRRGPVPDPWRVHMKPNSASRLLISTNNHRCKKNVFLRFLFLSRFFTFFLFFPAFFIIKNVSKAFNKKQF